MADLVQSNSRHDPTAADLLSFMSCIKPKPIPRSVLPTVDPEERMVHAICTLCAYAFMVLRDNKDIYGLHRPLHLAIRVWVREHGLAAEKTEKVIQHFAGIFLSNDYRNLALWGEVPSACAKTASN